MFPPFPPARVDVMRRFSQFAGAWMPGTGTSHTLKPLKIHPTLYLGGYSSPLRCQWRREQVAQSDESRGGWGGLHDVPL